MAETEYQHVPRTESEMLKLLNDLTTPLEGNIHRDIVGSLFELILRSMVDAGYTDVQVEMAKGRFKDLASRLDASDGSVQEAVSQLAEKITKGAEEIDWGDISQVVKNDLTDGKVAIVGENSVGALNLTSNAVTNAKISNKSVSRKKTGWYDRYSGETINLYTEEERRNGGYYSAGTWNDSDAWYSVKIKLNPNETYIKENFATTGIYDYSIINIFNEADVSIGNLNANTTTGEFTTHSNTDYGWFSVNISSTGEKRLYSKDYPSGVVDKGLKVQMGNFTKNSMPRSTAEWYRKTNFENNLYTEVERRDGGYYFSGTWTPAPGWYAVKVQLEPEEVYIKEHLSNKGRFDYSIINAFNDADVSVGNLAPNATDGSLTTVKNTAYAWFAVNSASTGKKKIYNKDYQYYLRDPYLLDASNSLFNLTWNALGDSITEGLGTTKSYVDYIKEETGIAVNNYGVSGNTISDIPGHWSGRGMSVRYSDMAMDADVITVFGGTNDQSENVVIGTWASSDTSTVYGATKTLLDGLLTQYPTKKIGFILPLPRHVINGVSNLGSYVDAIKDCCKRYSIPVLDLYTGSGLMPGVVASKNATMPDGTHPNAIGHKIIANKIKTFLEIL